MWQGILQNKVFRVCVVLIVIVFPFASKYRFVKTVGPSMQPTLEDGEWVVIERKSSLGNDWFPSRLHSVVIEDQGENLNKRIIGLPGDTIEIKKGIIYLNEKKLQDPFGQGKIGFYLVDDHNQNLRYWSGPEKGEVVVQLVSQGQERVPEGYVWVIGDNRRDSWFGLLPIRNIVGRILY
jgi:signal peptidase I